MASKTETEICTICSLEPSEKNPFVLQINSGNSSEYSSFFPDIQNGRLCKRCHAKFRYNSKRSCALKDLECCICHVHYPEGNFRRRFKVYIQAVKAIQKFYNDYDLKSGEDICNDCWFNFSSKVTFYGNDPNQSETNTPEKSRTLVKTRKSRVEKNEKRLTRSGTKSKSKRVVIHNGGVKPLKSFDNVNSRKKKNERFIRRKRFDEIETSDQEEELDDSKIESKDEMEIKLEEGDGAESEEIEEKIQEIKNVDKEKNEKLDKIIERVITQTKQETEKKKKEFHPFCLSNLLCDEEENTEKMKISNILNF
eukprot:gene8351-176_t